LAVVTIAVIITSDVHCFMIAVVCVLKSTDVASDGLETADICVLIITVVSARQHAERAICYRPSVCPSVCPSVRPSVRPSVTRVDQSKTVEARIMQFSPYSNPIPLVFAG